MSAASKPDAALMAPREMPGEMTTRENWRPGAQDVTDLALDPHGRLRWWLAFGLACTLVGLMAVSVGWLLWEGVGIWGNNIPVTWALDIVSYDWWIGIASGGLLVSSMLLLVGAEWRGAVNRIAETMGLISAAAAGLYPIIHLGRPWFFYWNLPYPNTFLLWPQWRSPLVWDAVDIISYLLVCLCFWYVGMLPDLAALRDRAYERVLQRTSREDAWVVLLKAQIYGIAALGWRGSTVHWQRWQDAYRVIALFGVLLIVSLQTGAAVMFAGTVEPGWHDTLLPVSFLLAAVFSGVAMVGVLLVVLRAAFALDTLITSHHFDLLARLLLGLGIANLYCYGAEFLTTWAMGSAFDVAVIGRRFTGPHAWSTWAVLLLALLPVQLFWIPALRRSAAMLLVVGLLIAAGSYADHFMVIVITLQHDFLPSATQAYHIGVWGVATFAGSIGLFLLLLLLFMRALPVVSLLGARGLVVPQRVAPPQSAKRRVIRVPQRHG